LKAAGSNAPQTVTNPTRSSRASPCTAHAAVLWVPCCCWLRLPEQDSSAANSKLLWFDTVLLVLHRYSQNYDAIKRYRAERKSMVSSDMQQYINCTVAWTWYPQMYAALSTWAPPPPHHPVLVLVLPANSTSACCSDHTRPPTHGCRAGQPEPESCNIYDAMSGFVGQVEGLQAQVAAIGNNSAALQQQHTSLQQRRAVLESAVAAQDDMLSQFEDLHLSIAERLICWAASACSHG